MSELILNTRVDATSYTSTCQYIQSLIQSQRSAYIVVANVHVVMTAYWNPKYREAINNAVLVVPDGMPLVLGMRWMGTRYQTRVYGPDLMHKWCEQAASTGRSVYFYGGSNETLEKLSKKMKIDFPNIKIAGVHSPPFRTLSSEEEAADVERIKQSDASVVFVGLGCPKQEEWMYRQIDKLDVVMIGVGAAFRFHSGEVAQAPRWLMKLSMEWLFRLFQEPGRLWSRYLLTNSTFVVLFAAQLLKHYMCRTVRVFDRRTLRE